MYRLLPLCAAAAAAASSSSAAAACLPPPAVDASARLFTTSAAFASWTVDPSRNRALFDVNFSDPRLLYLAAEIGGGLLRLGGGGADTMAFATGDGGTTCPGNRAGFECLNTSLADSLLALSAAARAPLIIGLALCPDGDPPPTQPHNFSNALALIRYVRAHAPLAIAGYELGKCRPQSFRVLDLAPPYPLRAPPRSAPLRPASPRSRASQATSATRTTSLR